MKTYIVFFVKTYIVFVDGVELPKADWIKSTGHNAAEKKAKSKYQEKYFGKDISVEYTEV